MAILNTFDEYREALKKVRLDEGIMVLKRGKSQLGRGGKLLF